MKEYLLRQDILSECRQLDYNRFLTCIDSLHFGKAFTPNGRVKKKRIFTLDDVHRLIGAIDSVDLMQVRRNRAKSLLELKENLQSFLRKVA